MCLLNEKKERPNGKAVYFLSLRISKKYHFEIMMQHILQFIIIFYFKTQKNVCHNFCF